MSGLPSLERNIMIVGVGGQGTLLASRVIGRVALKSGFDVKVSEVHGMAQRGGGVVSSIKYSENKIHSPIITEGQSDIILAFEILEAYRHIAFLKNGGKIITNLQKINPMPVITGQASYPADISGKIRDLGIDLIEIDALSKALEIGSQKVVNVVLIGLFAAVLDDFTKQTWLEAVEKAVPQKFLALNMKAFEAGYSYYKK